MAKSISLTKISEKLIELNDKYATLYPRFYLAELKYITLKAQYMREQFTNFASQQGRDAAVEELLSQSGEYQEYHSLKPEISTLEMQIKIYMQLSRNLNNMAWEETR